MARNPQRGSRPRGLGGVRSPGSRVTFNAQEVADFASRWPGSGLQGVRSIAFDFDHRGDLVGIERKGGRADVDESALSVLSLDARKVWRRHNPGKSARTNPISRSIDRRSVRSASRGRGRVLVGCRSGHWHPRARRGRQCDEGMRRVNPTVHVEKRGKLWAVVVSDGTNVYPYMLGDKPVEYAKRREAESMARTIRGFQQWNEAHRGNPRGGKIARLIAGVQSIVGRELTAAERRMVAESADSGLDEHMIAMGILESEDNPRRRSYGRGQIATFERFQFTLPTDALADLTGPGDKDEAASYWAKRVVRPAAVTPEALRAELREYGAWDAEQLADDDENWKRIIWIAAGNIREGNPRKRTPSRSPRSAVARARRTFRKWHEFDADKLVNMRGPNRRIPKVLVKLGEIPEIIYRSDKWEGKPVTYSHKTTSPLPVLATDPKGEHLFIVGGNVRVTADGLVN